MIELIVACVLATGTTFKPPEGWNVVEVLAYDNDTCCSDSAFGSQSCFLMMGCPIERKTTVTLRREAEVGELVALPEGCTAQAKVNP